MKALTGNEKPLCISCKKEMLYIYWVCYQYCTACMPADRKGRDGQLAKASRKVRSKSGVGRKRQTLAENFGEDVGVLVWEEFWPIDDEADPGKDYTKNLVHPVRTSVSTDLTQGARTQGQKETQEKDTVR